MRQRYQDTLLELLSALLETNEALTIIKHWEELILSQFNAESQPIIRERVQVIRSFVLERSALIREEVGEGLPEWTEATSAYCSNFGEADIILTTQLVPSLGNPYEDGSGEGRLFLDGNEIVVDQVGASFAVVGNDLTFLIMLDSGQEGKTWIIEGNAPQSSLESGRVPFTPEEAVTTLYSEQDGFKANLGVVIGDGLTVTSAPGAEVMTMTLKSELFCLFPDRCGPDIPQP